jgi:membrane-associated phospholipid phosphatase
MPWKKISVFVMMLFLFQCAGWIFWGIHGKHTAFLLLNGPWQQPYWAYVFYLFTALGEWPVIAFTIGMAYYLKRPYVRYVVMAFITGGLAIMLFKFGLCSHMSRPGLELKDADQLWVSPFLTTAFHHSFPSGHTMTAFIGFTSLQLLFKPGLWGQFVLFFCAMMAGFSRVFNGQHFIEDVLAGALLGYVISFVFLQILPIFASRRLKKSGT